MNYFTEAWANNWITEEMTPQQQQAVGVAYRERLAQIWPLLPPEAQVLEKTDLHDGLIRRITLDWSASTLLLELRCGCLCYPDDRPAGYFDLDICYGLISLTAHDALTLISVAQNKNSEVRYTEMDTENNGLFVHRLLFVNRTGHEEVDIRFRSLTFIQTPREDRGDKGGWPAADLVEIGERPPVSLDTPRKERSGKHVSPWLPIP